MSIKRTLLLGSCAIALSISGLFATDALAQQTLPSAAADRVEQQVPRVNLDGPTTSQVNIPEIRIEGAPEGADNIRFVLKTLTIEGVSAYSNEEIEAIYANDLGQTIDLTRLYAIAGEITRKYRNEGYVISQTVVPAQTIASGDARLLVVEGSLDQILVEGTQSNANADQIQALGAKLRASTPLKAADLERYLLLINDLPGLKARSVIGPSATQPGKADLRIIVDRTPFSALLGVDNYGSRFLGPWQATGAAQINNVSGHNDKVTVQYVSAPRDRELDYFYTAYQRTFGSEGTKMTLDFAHSDTEPGDSLEIFGVEGFSTTFGGTVEHPFIRSRNENLTGRVRLDIRSSSTKNDLGVSTDDDIRSLRIGGRYEKLSTFLGTSVNMVDVQVSKGLNFFNASQENDSDLSRAAGDPQYTKIEAEVTRLQRIIPDVNVLVGVKGQVASSALLSSEEFGVGGMGSGYGRGYDPSEIVGDDGLAAKTELQWNVRAFDDTLDSLQVFGFFDAGSVWNQDATTAAGKRNSIASTGFGVRSKITQSISADAIVAWPLNEPVASSQDEDPNVFVGLTTRF